MHKIVTHTIALTFMAGTCSAEEWSLDLGTGAGRMQVSNETQRDSLDGRPSITIGAHRQTSQNWRIGTSMELLVEELNDWGGSTNVLMWRMGDVDYRVSENIAINIHGGFARYYREQPSYGYGYGAGVKYRLSENWYLAFSATAAEVDVSTDVPTENHTATKDDLVWASLTVHLVL